MILVCGRAWKTYRFDTNLIAVDNISRARVTNGWFRRVSVASIVCGRKSEPAQTIGPNFAVHTMKLAQTQK